jgi:hypothetical protein
LLALVAGAPSEPGRLLLEFGGALGLLACGVVVVGVLAFEAKRLGGGAIVELPEGVRLGAGDCPELFVGQTARSFELGEQCPLEHRGVLGNATDGLRFRSLRAKGESGDGASSLAAATGSPAR